MEQGFDKVESTVENLLEKLNGLPAAIAQQLDARADEKIEAVRIEYDQRIKRLEEDNAFYKKLVWGVVSFVFAELGTVAMVILLTN